MATAPSAGLAPPRLRFPRRRAIPSADVGSLGKSASRTRAVRLALGLAIVGVLTAAWFVSRGLEVRQGGFLPVGSTGVMVLDLSTSVSEESNRRIARVIQNIVNTDQPTGLVIFSDSAYELMPPGTRGVEFRPLLRFFTTQRLSPEERARQQARGRIGAAANFIDNPWTSDFRGGTRISAGLALARSILRRDGITDGSVVLVSDLDYSPFDFGDLTETLIRYRTDDIPLRIIPLFPSPQDRELFKRLLGEDAVAGWQELEGRIGPRSRNAFSGVLPWTLIGLGVLATILLAANEWRCGRLELAGKGARA
jgi:hypothetical protein